MQEYLFHKILRASKNSPRNILYMILMDLCFVAIFMLLYLLAASVIPQDPGFVTTLQQDSSVLIVAILLVIAYIFINLAVYSFVKFVVIENMKRISAQSSNGTIIKKRVTPMQDYTMLKRMFLINIVLFFIFFIYVILCNILLGLVMNQSVWLLAIVILIAGLIAIIMYTFYHFTHSACAFHIRVRDILKFAWKNLWTKRYIGIILFDIGAMAAYALLYILSGIVFKDTIAAHFNIYVTITGVTSILVVYILFFVNRIHFFMLTEKNVARKVQK